jgi:hypothetical protein
MRRFTLGVLAVAIAGTVAISAEPRRQPGPAGRIVGEWSQVVTVKKANDTLMVWTFRPTGVCRLDALDRATGKQPRGPDVHLPGVGSWKIDGKDLLVTWEKWSDSRQRPVRDEVRLRLEKLTDKELVTRLIPADRPDAKEKPARWTRFEGWAMPEK